MSPEPPRVHLPCVELRPAVDDPLRDQPAHASRSGKPVRAEAGGDPEAAHLAGTEDELAVGCERLGTVNQAHDLGVFQCRHADDCVVHQRLETVPVLF